MTTRTKPAKAEQTSPLDTARAVVAEAEQRHAQLVEQLAEHTASIDGTVDGIERGLALRAEAEHASRVLGAARDHLAATMENHRAQLIDNLPASAAGLELGSGDEALRDEVVAVVLAEHQRLVDVLDRRNDQIKAAIADMRSAGIQPDKAAVNGWDRDGIRIDGRWHRLTANTAEGAWRWILGSVDEGNRGHAPGRPVGSGPSPEVLATSNSLTDVTKFRNRSQ